MADQQSFEGSSTSNVSGEGSESSVELNIKTLDSQVYSFHVDKNMPISVFKEKIASQIGVPVELQRLIFRGKVLKDEHPLSEYHVENGHTLHLVERQPSQPSTASSGETSTNNAGRGQEANGNGARNRVGQISHSVVLGTFNVGDQGEGMVPDLSRVIGAVLNSIGIGSQTAVNATSGVQPSVQAPQGNVTEGTRSNIGIQSQTGNQSVPGPASFNQSSPQAVQIPVGIAVPPFNPPIPDSLNTLSEFMNRMELALSQNGYGPNQSPNDPGEAHRADLPSNAREFPTPEALIGVLRHAERLLGGQTTSALSHIAGRLEQDGGSTDPMLRAQIQAESMQVGRVMQHLGALLLELGRTILTLRMGQSRAESSINAGPAVYISPTGPNPIMVQPFPLQTSSLFSGSTVASPNAAAVGPVGIPNIPRHVNIHIHAGPSFAATRATNGEATQGERASATGSSGDSGQTRVLPVRNVVATAGSSQPGVPQHSLVSALSSISRDDYPSLIRNVLEDRLRENQGLSGESVNASVQRQSVAESSSQLGDMAGSGVGEASVPLLASASASGTEAEKTQPECGQSSNNDSNVPATSSGASGNCSSAYPMPEPVTDKEGASRSGPVIDNPAGPTAVPLGLGLGGLQPKRRSKQQRSRGNSDDGGTSSGPATNPQQTKMNGQQVLQSLASLAASGNANSQPSGQAARPTGEVMEGIPSGGRSGNGQFDPSSVMSGVLQSPALGGLLSGVSQQTGVGSPDMFRNMLQQLTQNPTMMSTVNQIAQQIDGQDVGNMFSGGGGGFDLSRMVQQMMPIVSQALGGGASVNRPMPTMECELPERRPSGYEQPIDQNPQVDFEQVVWDIQNGQPPTAIFRSMVENVVRTYGGGSGFEDLVDEIGSEECLANEFVEMLHNDLSRRLQHETEEIP